MADEFPAHPDRWRETLGRPHSSGELLAEGRPVHAGRRHQLWSVEVRRGSDGKLVARGQVRFHVLEELPRQSGG